MKSKIKCLNNFNESNGLNLKSRIQRDIHNAYCCEYIGTPEENIKKVSKAIQILLGAKKEVPAVKYWAELKAYCYSNLEKIERILISKAESF